MNNDSIRIYVTGSCEGLDNLRDALASHPDVDFVGWSENVAEATTALAGGHLRVVVHATRSTSFPAGEIAAIREHTRSPIVILASGESSALLEEALDADGVADVLLLPQLTENVVFALRKAAHAGRRLVAEGAAQGRQGRIVTVFSPKGGTGKTVTATNLAASFAKYEQKRTLLLDLDLQFGDAAIMLGLEPEKTIYDLVVAPGELDSEKLAGYITKHTCGLDILPAPLRPEDAELVTETKLARLLEVARESYDIIVVDTSPFFHGPMLATLDRTDELLMLCGLDVPTLEERAPLDADARAALVPGVAHPLRPQPGQLEGRDEEERGRGSPRRQDRLRSAIGPGRPDRRQPGRSPGDRRHGLGLRQGDPRRWPSRCSQPSSRRRGACSPRWRRRRPWVSTTDSRSRTETGPPA